MPFDVYADHLASWQLSVKGDAFSATHNDGTHLTYPPTDADPDPIGEALHVSPALTLNANDLVQLVDGNDSLPFV